MSSSAGSAAPDPAKPAGPWIPGRQGGGCASRAGGAAKRSAKQPRLKLSQVMQRHLQRQQELAQQEARSKRRQLLEKLLEQQLLGQQLPVCGGCTMPCDLAAAFASAGMIAAGVQQHGLALTGQLQLEQPWHLPPPLQLLAQQQPPAACEQLLAEQQLMLLVQQQQQQQQQQ